MAWMPMAANVPMTVAKTEAVSVIQSVVANASMIVSFFSISAYQWVVKPPQTTLDLESLKERTIKTRMGRYKNKKIAVR